MQHIRGGAEHEKVSSITVLALLDNSKGDFYPFDSQIEALTFMLTNSPGPIVCSYLIYNYGIFISFTYNRVRKILHLSFIFSKKSALMFPHLPLSHVYLAIFIYIYIALYCEGNSILHELS